MWRLQLGAQVLQAAAGGRHTLAVLADGTAASWGWGGDGDDDDCGGSGVLMLDGVVRTARAGQAGMHAYVSCA